MKIGVRVLVADLGIRLLEPAVAVKCSGAIGDQYRSLAKNFLVIMAEDTLRLLGPRRPQLGLDLILVMQSLWIPDQ